MRVPPAGCHRLALSADLLLAQISLPRHPSFSARRCPSSSTASCWEPSRHGSDAGRDSTRPPPDRPKKRKQRKPRSSTFSRRNKRTLSSNSACACFLPTSRLSCQRCRITPSQRSVTKSKRPVARFNWRRRIIARMNPLCSPFSNAYSTGRIRGPRRGVIYASRPFRGLHWRKRRRRVRRPESLISRSPAALVFGWGPVLFAAYSERIQSLFAGHLVLDHAFESFHRSARGAAGPSLAGAIYSARFVCRISVDPFDNDLALGLVGPRVPFDPPRCEMRTLLASVLFTCREALWRS